MADDVKDIAIYTGSEWTSLSELAAGVVDAKLPIESVDGTVKLDGASSLFTVSTGVTETMRSGSTYFRCASAAGNYFYAEQVGNYQAIWIGGKGGSGGTGGVGIQTAKVTGPDTDGRNLTIASGASTGAGLTGELVFATSNVGPSGSTENSVSTRLKIDNQNRVLVNTPNPPDGTPANVLYVNGSAIVSTSIQTPSVRGRADNDASVTLGANFTVSTGGQERVRVRSDGNVGFGNAGHAFARLTSGGTNVQSGGAASIAVNAMYTATTDGTSAKPQVFSFYSSPTIVDDAEKPIENLAHFYATSTAPDIVENHYGIYLGVEGGRNAFNIYAASRSPNYFGGDIQVEAQQKIECRTYKGPVSNDAEIKLSDQATLKKGDGSEYVPTAANSIATKKTVDDKIWVGTTAQYLAIPIRDILPTTLYCLTD